MEIVFRPYHNIFAGKITALSFALLSQVARSRVFLVVEKPMHWINVHPNINGVRFETLSFR